MRNSGLLKWASNNKNNKAKTEDKGGNNKNWLHSPETLKTGHVVYLVKFLGSTEVDKPKGIDVVQQGIQKLKFNQQLKKSEGATKTPKVELTISVEGVAIQEPKTKKVLHQYPLHKISYCADDKAEKRFFSFISKEADTDKHTCFVFVSDKLAEEITLTIGQAFELAYKKFLDTSGKDMETKKALLALQKRVALIENENNILKSRLNDVSKFKEVKEYMKANNLTDLGVVADDKDQTDTEKSGDGQAPAKKGDTTNELICFETNVENGAIDGLTLDDLNDDYFNPRAGSSDDDDDVQFDPRSETPKEAPPQAPAAPILAPPPALPPRDASKVNSALASNTSPPVSNGKHHTDNVGGNSANNIFQTTTNPFSSPTTPIISPDPFGMSTFSASSSNSQPFFDSPPFSKFQGEKATMSGGPSAFGDAWTKVPAVPPINGLSLDELDPLKK